MGKVCLESPPSKCASRESTAGCQAGSFACRSPPSGRPAAAVPWRPIKWAIHPCQISRLDSRKGGTRQNQVHQRR
jgi:hypothetical protein